MRCVGGVGWGGVVGEGRLYQGMPSVSVNHDIVSFRIITSLDIYYFSCILCMSCELIPYVLVISCNRVE